MRKTLVDPSQALSGLDLYSIGQINALPPDQRARVYHSLIPTDVILRFDIDPQALKADSDSHLFKVRAKSTSVSLSLRHTADAVDPLLYLQLADTSSGQIEVLMFIVNDPHAERFDTDRLPDGTPTLFGTQERNIAEEIEAMEAGLAPGQVRRGLRLTRDLIPILERFVAALHHDTFYIQPLAYHNAILFERLGFSYVMGLGRMEWIDKEFAPGGLLHRRLDGSTPFRQPGAGKTVRGRSWAIHDGIMGMPYQDVKMYKRVAVHAGIITFPNAVW
ncbi:MAG: hypothetical protein ACOC7N_00475 [Chloroflexota bacterium]